VDDRETNRSTAERDAAIESAVLQLALALHPASLTVEELAREMGADGGAERDALERAVRDLSGAGLLRRRAGVVTPTRAALRFDELMER
jgi:hypothetical protein